MKSSFILLQSTLLMMLVLSPSFSYGKAADIKKWLDGATEVEFEERSSSLALQPALKYEKIDTEIQKVVILADSIIEAAKVRNEPKLIVYYNKDPGKNHNMPDARYKSDANWLPYVENKASFLQMNHRKRGDFFITPPIHGCDIWIAEAANQEPFVVHINYNKVKDGVQNLLIKEDIAQRVLHHINSQSEDATFKYTMRIAYQFKETDTYWTTFEDSNEGIDTFTYYDNHFFYGLYDTDECSEGWTYYLKKNETGKIEYKKTCMNEKEGCHVPSSEDEEE